MFLIQDVDFPGNPDYKIFILIVDVIVVVVMSVFSINDLITRHC